MVQIYDSLLFIVIVLYCSVHMYICTLYSLFVLVSILEARNKVNQCILKLQLNAEAVKCVFYTFVHTVLAV